MIHSISNPFITLSMRLPSNPSRTRRPRHPRPPCWHRPTPTHISSSFIRGHCTLQLPVSGLDFIPRGWAFPTRLRPQQRLRQLCRRMEGLACLLRLRLVGLVRGRSTLLVIFHSNSSSSISSCSLLRLLPWARFLDKVHCIICPKAFFLLYSCKYIS